MTLQEAIEILDLGADVADMRNKHNFRDALNMSIEAMLFLKSLRANYKPKGFKLLPGETED